MKAIRIEALGPHYRLVVDSEPSPSPGPGQVRIKVAAAGLNFADLMQARGKYPPPPGASMRMAFMACVVLTPGPD